MLQQRLQLPHVWRTQQLEKYTTSTWTFYELVNCRIMCKRQLYFWVVATFCLTENVAENTKKANSSRKKLFLTNKKLIIKQLTASMKVSFDFLNRRKTTKHLCMLSNMPIWLNKLLSQYNVQVYAQLDFDHSTCLKLNVLWQVQYWIGKQVVVSSVPSSRDSIICQMP